MSISCSKKKTLCMCYITILGTQGLAAVSVKLEVVATKCPDWMVLSLKWLSKKSIVLSLVHKRLAAVWLN
jgi:hypothetical protein